MINFRLTLMTPEYKEYYSHKYMDVHGSHMFNTVDEAKLFSSL